MRLPDDRGLYAPHVKFGRNYHWEDSPHFTSILWNFWYNWVARFLLLPALKSKILLKVALVVLATFLVELIRFKKKESVGHYWKDKTSHTFLIF